MPSWRRSAKALHWRYLVVESGGKPPFDGVIFLPGLLCDERLFAPQVDSLAAVVNSAGEQLYPTEVAHLGDYDSIESMAHAVFENTRFERFALVGLSMGGALAMNMARMAPQRVERMALFDANPGTDDERRRANRRRQLAEATRVGVGEFTRRELIDLYLAPDSRTPELVDLTVAMAERHGIATYERQLQALMNRSDSRPYLADYEGRALVLCGELDRMCSPTLHEEMAQLLPHSTLVVLPGIGHLATVEAPLAVNAALLEFLQS